MFKFVQSWFDLGFFGMACVVFTFVHLILGHFPYSD